MMGFAILFILLAQSTQPADATMDWLLQQSAPATQPTTTPAAMPASQPASPFADKPAAGERQGTIVLSDDSLLSGILYTTPGKPIRLWDGQKQQYADLQLDSIRSMEAIVLWERDEPEWRFKESGHDEKILTGQTYPARETEYRVTLTNGDQLVGGIVAPIYVRAPDGKTTQLVLHKRDKGPAGKKLKDLVYIRHMTME